MKVWICWLADHDYTGGFEKIEHIYLLQEQAENWLVKVEPFIKQLNALWEKYRNLDYKDLLRNDKTGAVSLEMDKVRKEAGFDYDYNFCSITEHEVE